MPYQPTFPPRRVLFLLLIGPLTVIAVVIGIRFGPGGDQPFRTPTAPPVVQWIPALGVIR